MSEESPIAAFEERWAGWRRTFVLYEDRLEVTYARWLAGHGQGTIPLDLVTEYREREWVKHEGLHGLVVAVALLGASALSLALYRFTGVRDHSTAVFGIPVAIVLATLAFVVFDPPRLDYVKIQLANGVHLRLGSIRGRTTARDAFVEAIEAGVRARAGAQSPAAPPAAGEKEWMH